MMISPETYYETQLKGKSAKQLKSKIHGLKSTIGILKSNIKNFKEFNVDIDPSPKTQLMYYQSYLNKAIALLEKVQKSETSSTTDE